MPSIFVTSRIASRRRGALTLLSALEPTRQERIETVLADGYPAYNTSVGWMGYSDDKIRRLCKESDLPRAGPPSR